MGKKSRRKKENKSKGGFPVPANSDPAKTGSSFALILLEIIKWGSYAALFAPLVVHPSFFFPFVVPKTVVFWMFAEVIFAAWILLAISNKQYRIKWNLLSVSFLVFLGVTILTSFTGINIERSFWSTFERMVGTINWLHLGMFFFAVSSTFKTYKDWRRLIIASLIASSLVAIIFLFQRIGVSLIPFNTKSGSTIGNSSFMAAYLLFNVFLGIWLVQKSLREYFKNKSLDVFWPVVFSSILAFLALTILFSTAYGALLAMLGGGFILFLCWLFFGIRRGWSRYLAVSLLVLGTLIGGVVVWGTFTQNETVIGKLPYFFSNKGTIGARMVIWDMAIQGIKERPWLGWGPENFNVVFAKYFNPCLPLSECGGEVWFDRTHNIIFDSLINSGILGLLSYLFVFLSALFMAWRKFFKEKDSGGWILPAVITAILASYFVQNLLVFDMINTYIMFALAIAFVAGRAGVEGGDSSGEKNEKIKSPNKAASFIVFALLFYYLFSFGVQSLQAANWGLEIGRNSTVFSSQRDRIDLYKKSLSVSPIGNRQIVEFFTNGLTTQVLAGSKYPPELIKAGEEIMLKTVKENPMDFRHLLLLGNYYNATSQYDSSYAERAEEVLNKAAELSPRNQQVYMALGQTYILMANYGKTIDMMTKARDLEPRSAKAYWILGEAYDLAGITSEAQKNYDIAQDMGYLPSKKR